MMSKESWLAGVVPLFILACTGAAQAGGFEKLSCDVAYAHLFAKSGSINVVPGNPVYVT